MSILQTLAELERKGEPVAVATVVRSQGSVPRHDGSKMLIYPDGRIDGTIGGGDMESRVIKEALAALKDGETRKLSYAFRDVQKGDVGVCGGEVEVFVEPLLSKPQVIIAGGGHVGKAVAHLAHWLGFHVVVSDDRPEFATPEAVPSADEHIHCALAELPSRTRVDQNSYILLTTRGDARRHRRASSTCGNVGRLHRRDRLSPPLGGLRRETAGQRHVGRRYRSDHVTHWTRAERRVSRRNCC